MLINPWDFHPPYVAVMCPRCSTVHTAVPLSVVLRDCSSRGELAHYYVCSNCGVSTSKFVYAGSGDAPAGHEGSKVVVGHAPDVPAPNGEKRTLYFETVPETGEELLELIELYVARLPDLYPMRFRLYGVDVDDALVRTTLTASAPLAAAKALMTSYLDFFD